MQDVEAAHAFVAGDDVRGGVAFGMADVQAGAARIGEHVEDVVFRLGRIESSSPGFGAWKAARFIPDAPATSARSGRKDTVCGARSCETIRTRKQEINEKSLTLSSHYSGHQCGLVVNLESCQRACN